MHLGNHHLRSCDVSSPLVQKTSLLPAICQCARNHYSTQGMAELCAYVLAHVNNHYWATATKSISFYLV